MWGTQVGFLSKAWGDSFSGGRGAECSCGTEEDNDLHLCMSASDTVFLVLANGERERESAKNGLELCVCV